jgi:hypothetical protein
VITLLMLVVEAVRGLVQGVREAFNDHWAPAAPAPAPVRDEPGLAVWDGGLVLGGPLLRIPGRALNLTDPDQLAEARQHAASVTAAVVRHETGAASA